MSRRLMRLLLLVLPVLWNVGKAYGQTPSPSPGSTASTEVGPPILQYLFAILALALIMMILMMPTRKSQ